MGRAERNPSASFAEADFLTSGAVRPGFGVQAEPYHPMEGRKRPILHPLHMAVLDRIEVNLIGVPR
jgi:hypothetical protein